MGTAKCFTPVGTIKEHANLFSSYLEEATPVWFISAWFSLQRIAGSLQSSPKALNLQHC